MKRICVLGLGHIGIPTAALLATHGYKVVGVDVDAQRVEALNSGEGVWNGEPGLAELVKEAIKSGRFRASSAVEAAEIFIISVPTPLQKATRKADLRQVIVAARSVARVLSRHNLVVLESTVPPGTTEGALRSILEVSGLRAGNGFFLCHCPERAVPGSTVHELVHNDRVIGGIDDRSAQEARNVYAAFVKGELHLTTARTAEMVKLMENTTRDINIALANEFALLAEEQGVNVWEAIDLANRHPRVKILRPGPGVGGHCIPLDPWFLAQQSRNAHLIVSGRKVNDMMPAVVAGKVRKVVRSVRGPVVALFGVTYKGNVADTRESPAGFLLRHLPASWEVRCHDPKATQFAYPLLSLDAAVTGAHCIVLLADHDEYLYLDPVRLGALMARKNIVDTRNHLDRHSWEQAGFEVVTLGIPGTNSPAKQSRRRAGRRASTHVRREARGKTRDSRKGA